MTDLITTLFDAYDHVNQTTREIRIDIPKRFPINMKQYERNKFQEEAKPISKKEYERNPPLYYKDKFSTMRLCHDKDMKYYVKICDQRFELIQHSSTRFTLELPKHVEVKELTLEEEAAERLRRAKERWNYDKTRMTQTKLSKNFLEDFLPRRRTAKSLDENELINIMHAKSDDE